MRCGDDDVGCARPDPESLPVHPTEAIADAVTPPADARTEPVARVPYRARIRGDDSSAVAVAPDDLARLNSLLGDGLRFEVEPVRPRDTRDIPDGAPAATAGASERVPVAMGTLVHACPQGGPRRASHPVSCSLGRRPLLHSLAASLAECAMALGLGAGVYHGRSVGARPATREST